MISIIIIIINIIIHMIIIIIDMNLNIINNINTFVIISRKNVQPFVAEAIHFHSHYIVS